MELECIFYQEPKASSAADMIKHIDALVKNIQDKEAAEDEAAAVAATAKLVSAAEPKVAAPVIPEIAAVTAPVAAGAAAGTEGAAETAAPPVTEAVPLEPMSLLTHRNSMSYDMGSYVIAPGVIQQLTHTLTTRLWKDLITRCDPVPFKPCDQGLREVKISDPYSTSPKMSTVPSNKSLCFNFVGEVVRVPVKGCLPLCEAFGQKFWMAPGPFKSFACDAFVPAWQVPINDKGGATMDVQKRTEKFEFEHTQVMSKKTMTINLSIYYMHLTEKAKQLAVTQDAAHVSLPLSRPTHVDMITIAPATGVPGKGTPKGKGKGAKGDMKAVALSDPTWKQCKHLFK